MAARSLPCSLRFCVLRSWFMSDDKAYPITMFVASQCKFSHIAKEETTQYEGSITVSLLWQLWKTFWSKFWILYCLRLGKSDIHLISNNSVVSLIWIKILCGLGFQLVFFTVVCPEPGRVHGTFYITNRYSEQNILSFNLPCCW